MTYLVPPITRPIHLLKTSLPMDLYLTPDDPENTTLMSANGVAHFRVTTMKSSSGSVTYLQRPSETLEAGLLAKVQSGKGKKTTIVQSTLLGTMTPNQDGQGVDASKFLYRKGRFSASSRYFMGNDGAEYRWKYQRSLGWTLTSCTTGDEIAQQVRWSSQEGVFAGQRKCALRIHPCMIDIELIILSFVMAEKKRRARMNITGNEAERVHMDIDGGASGAEAEGIDSIACGEL